MRPFALARSVLACFALAPRLAAAQPAPAAASTAPRRVELAISAAPAERDALEASVVELLGRLAVALEVRHAERVDVTAVVTPRPDPAGRPPPVARMWLDARSAAGTTLLYIVDGPWERVLIRRVPTRGPDDEVAREEIALIVQDAVAALLAGARIGLDRREVAAAHAPPPPRSPRPPPPPRARPVRVALGAFYEAQLFAPEAPWAHGPGVAVGVLAGRPLAAFGGEFTAQFRAPLDVARDPIGVRLTQGALRWLAAAELRPRPRVRLRLALGGGLDVVHVEPQRAPGAGPNATLDPARVLAVFVARGAVALDVVLAGPFALTAQLGADLDPSGVYYFVAEGAAATERVIVAPRVARPFAALGFTFGL